MENHMKICFINTKTILPGEITGDAVIAENGKIIYIGKMPETTDGMRIIDGEGLYLSPGFVDIHVHGGGGHGVMEREPDGICAMCETHLRHGTTSILPTTLAAPIDVLQEAIFAVKEAQKKQAYKTILGIHLEGPFLSPFQKGAQSEESILPVKKRDGYKAFGYLERHTNARGRPRASEYRIPRTRSKKAEYHAHRGTFRCEL